ncbi:Spermine oxidase, partial [Stegodyphus mimosarum]
MKYDVTPENEKSSWLLDPTTYGSYSYLSVDCAKANALPSDIAEPEYSNLSSYKHPVLLFAGEASHSSYFSTVHGACESGLREADRLHRHYRCSDVSKLTNICSSEQYKKIELLSYKKSLRDNLKVLIIGAGVAGLTCGLYLSNCNFNDVSILEAQERIGGRISSINYNGSVIELGAQWIHGIENPLYVFSKAYELLADNLNEISYEGKGLFCTPAGAIDKMIVEEVQKVLNDAKIALGESCYPESDIPQSVTEYFSRIFQKYLASCSDDYNRSIKLGLFNWFLTFEMIDNGSDDLSDVSVQSYIEWADCPDDLYHINFKKGFSTLIDILNFQLPDNTVLLNKAVKNVKWHKSFCYDSFNESSLKHRSCDKFPVLVECEDGEKMSADCVIISASVGFLKENMDTFFSPSLPENKIKALYNIGFGTMDKIFLIFDEPFWTSDDHGFQIIWANEDEKSIILQNENPWVRGISGFDVVWKQPNTLLGWIVGAHAKTMESIDEKQVGIICAELLRIFLNKPDIPYPAHVYRSCWFNNQYIRGSYSNRTMAFYQCGATASDIQEPICATYTTKTGKEIQWPILMFAGEAVDDVSFSSAHGAFKSALKSASFLLTACSDIEVYDGDSLD